VVHQRFGFLFVGYSFAKLRYEGGQNLTAMLGELAVCCRAEIKIGDTGH
jgi:hypothetical protein